MVRPRGLRLAALCPLLVATAWISRSFVGPVVPSRSPSTLRHFKNAPEAEPEQPKDALEDVWRYIGGWYEVKKIDGKLYFRENNLQGELVAQDDWLVAELPPSGTIRLKLGPSGQEVLSNFKPADTDAGLHGGLEEELCPRFVLIWVRTWLVYFNIYIILYNGETTCNLKEADSSTFLVLLCLSSWIR